MRLSTLLPSAVVAACIPVALAIGLFNSPPVDSGWNSRLMTALADLDSLRSAVKLKIADDGAAPTEAEGLDVLVHGKTQELDWLKKDPWGHPYAYHVGASGPAIYSVGPNGVDEHGDGDDVTTQDKSYHCVDYARDCGITREDLLVHGSLLLAVALYPGGRRRLRMGAAARRGSRRAGASSSSPVNRRFSPAVPQRHRAAPLDVTRRNATRRHRDSVRTRVLTHVSGWVPPPTEQSRRSVEFLTREPQIQSSHPSTTPSGTTRRHARQRHPTSPRFRPHPRGHPRPPGWAPSH